jgi:hypothetical protein
MAKKRRKQKHGPCAFCRKPASTRDHVPPKGLFGQPLPSNLITVPACRDCNAGAGQDDEVMQEMAVMWGAERSPDGVQAGAKVLRGIERPAARGRRADFYRRLSPVSRGR